MTLRVASTTVEVDFVLPTLLLFYRAGFFKRFHMNKNMNITDTG